MLVKLVQVHTDPDMELTAEERAHIAEIELRVPRGEILDRDGRLLAKDRPVFSLWANPRGAVDPEMVALSLSTQLGIDENEVLARLTRRDEKNSLMRFVWLKRWLTDKEVDAFDTLDPSLKYGLELKKESVRFYPEGELAAHVVGFVNRDGFGCDGIEMAYDKHLRSIPGRHKSRVDAKRNILRSLIFESEEPEGGDTVHLTIDKATQRILEQGIDKALVSSQAPRGMGIVVDVKTGEILAMACRPAFDPNAPGDVKSDNFRNRAVEFVFEPGSSFKIVAASGALEHGLVTTETMINCENGAFNPYGHRIRDFHRLGVIPFSHCFAESSNIAMIKVGAMLGPERLEQWITRFGFGRKASPDFPLESSGIFRPRSKWSGLSMGALPMGQEIAVTMPQLARAFCVIASGGFLRDLHVVDRVVDRSGAVTYEYKGEEPERILSDATAKTMKDLCHLVVLHGTGQPACIPEYRVGGKTGTAQIAEKGRGFVPGKFTAIFAGFAPIADPRVCCVIIIQEPAIKLHFGGSICGPVFKEVVRDTLIRMNCPPDPVLEGPGAVQSAPEEDEDTVLASSESDTPLPETDSPLDPLQLAAVANGSEPAGGEPLLPNFAGMTKRQTKEYLDSVGIRWDPEGAGRVVSQDPAPGTNLREVTLCRLVFSSKAPEQNDAAKPSPKPARM